MNGVNLFESMLEFANYTNSLPSFDFHTIRDRITEVLEGETSREYREELNIIHTLDRTGLSIFFPSLVREIEMELNQFLKEEYPGISVQIQQQYINGVPILAHEITILDNRQTEAIDPMIDWVIEYGAELN